jgi:hypothetical protein
MKVAPWIFGITLVLGGHSAAQQAPAGVGHPGDYGYLVVKGTQLRTAPSATADIAGTITEPTCIMRATDASSTGWVQLEPVTSQFDVDSLPNDPPVKREPCHRLSVSGWTKLDPDMALPDTAALSNFTHISIWLGKWPVSVAVDVLHHRPRIGFTEEQARSSMSGFGDPTVQTTETAQGVVKVYLYSKAGKMIGLRNGRVVSITDIQ